MTSEPRVRTSTAAEVRSGERIRGRFLVRRVHRGVGKTGKPWLQLWLGDRTGVVDARVWEDADEIAARVRENDVVDAEGVGVQYMDRTQLKLLRIDPVEADAGQKEALLPQGDLSREERMARLEAERDRIDNPWLRRLFQCFLDDDAWLDGFLRAPAAKSVHHAWLGGLSEHSLSMMQLARQVAEHYRDLGVAPLEPDLVVMGAFVHDIGKIEELSSESGFEYTDRGRLIGHIVLGLDVLDDMVARLDGFPAELHTHLRHMVLSHHGEYEYGSPRRPKTVEAMILHFIDNLDARVEIFRQVMQASGPDGGDWSGYETVLGRHVWRRPLGPFERGEDEVRGEPEA